MSEFFSGDGDCYDEFANFERLKTTENDEFELAWIEALTHHAAQLESKTRQHLMRRGLPYNKDEVEEYKQMAWITFYEKIHAIQWEGEQTILNLLSSFVDNKARAEQRRRGKNPTQTFSNLDSTSSENQGASEDIIELKLGKNNSTPPAEESVFNYINFTLVRQTLAATFEAKWFSGAKICALWVFTDLKMAQITVYVRQKDIRNDLSRAKRTFVNDFRGRLQQLCNEHDGDAYFNNLVGLLDAYVHSNKDGDLNKNHIFIEHLRQFVPHEIDPSHADWFPTFIANLKHSTIDDFLR